MADQTSGGDPEPHAATSEPSPPPSPDPEAVAGQGAEEQKPADTGRHRRQQRVGNPFRFLNRLTINEGLTLLVAIGGLGVSFLAYLNASDTRDIKLGVRGLADLAHQASIQAGETKRQADELHTQFAQVKRQADAAEGQLKFLGQQVTEAKAQTKAISRQTDAIKASSDAAVKTARAEIDSAQSQKRSAEAIAANNLPQPSLTGVDIDGLADKPGSDGLIQVSIKPTFTNVGGGSLFQAIGVFKIILENTLPPVPDYNGGVPFGGNELTVVHGATFYPGIAPKFPFPPANAKAFADGERGFFLIGIVDYSDSAEQRHRRCYAYVVMKPKDRPVIFYNVPMPTYHCQS